MVFNVLRGMNHKVAMMPLVTLAVLLLLTQDQKLGTLMFLELPSEHDQSNLAQSIIYRDNLAKPKR